LGGAAKVAKGWFVQFAPDLLARFAHHATKAAPGVAQCHAEQAGAMPAFARRVQRQGPSAVVDLGFFSGGELQAVELLWFAKPKFLARWRNLWVAVDTFLFQRVWLSISAVTAPAVDSSSAHRTSLWTAAARCSNPLKILDRFHIVAKMNDAVNDVRSAEARKLVTDGYEPVLAKSRWCVLKRRENLTRNQRFRLRDLLKYNLQTVRAYLLAERFQQFWDYDSPTCAGKFLGPVDRPGHAFTH